MPLIIPLGHEYIRKRFPRVTVTLIVLNTVIYFITFNVQVFQLSRVAMEDSRLEDYEIELMLKYLEEEKKESDPHEALRSMGPEKFERFRKEFRKAMRAGKVVKIDSIEYQKWKELYNEHLENESRVLWMRFGLRPSSFKIHALFTSMFLHGGFWHLFWNMYFLWLVGCNIEDVWGRKFFLILYLAGGVFASIVHTLLYFRSPLGELPLVGASGAIAAIMGAFLIRYWESKIRILFFIWIFWVPAWLALIAWFLQQLYYGFNYMNEASGVAFWAHIGGFLFGAAVAIGLQNYKIEDKVLAHELAKQDEKDRKRFEEKQQAKSPYNMERPEELVLGIQARKIGDYVTAREHLERAAELYPENFNVHLELQQVYQRMGLVREANLHQGVIVGVLLSLNMIDAALERYGLLVQADPEAVIPGQHQYRMARLLEERREYESAAVAYRKFAVANPDDPAAPKALYQCGMIILEKLRQPHAATAMFEYILNKYPAAPGYEFVKASLEQAKTRAGGSR